MLSHLERFHVMWPVSSGFESASKGFSDEKLEQLSRHSLFERGLTPWATWESENSSLGKTFRKWACYPSALPLCFCSDHGVHWESRCWPNEVDSPYETFFTWNKKKSIAMKLEHGKSSYYVPHPWVFYRKKYYGNPPPIRSGTLVYYAHSNSLSNPTYKNLDDYMASLVRLPEKYQPICLCVSFHDIEKGTHKKLRKYGIPIVTAGSTGARDFVDRFYSLIYQFRYATSPNIGSHTYYVLEAGVPFFVFGDHPEYHLKGSDAVPDGPLNLKDYGDDDDIERLEHLRLLLSQRVDTVTEEQRTIVSEYLGLDSDMTRIQAAKILWGAFAFNAVQVLQLYVTSFWRLAKKMIAKK
jgi:hypothetical protein